MIKKLWGLPVVIGLLVITGILTASGLSLFEVGSRAATMSGAYVGLADNSSAIYYNPAGIAFQKGVGFRINVIYSKYKVTAESNAEQDSGSYDSVDERLQSSFFVSWNFLERISIGLGGFTPYAIGIHWPSNWPGERLNSISKVSTFYLRPAVAWRVTDALAIGAGLDIVWASQRWDADVYSFNIIMNSSGTGIGFSGGILFRLSDHFQLGGRYQHRVKVDQHGTYKVQSTPGNTPRTNLSGVFSAHDNSATAQGAYFSGAIMSPQDTADVQGFYDITYFQTLPSEAVFGLMWSPMKKLTLLADAQWTEWSTFDKSEFAPEDLNDDPIYTINFNWKDTWSYKFGIEYFIKEILSIRGGYAHHQSPSPDDTLSPIFPVLPHNVLSFGVGYNGPVRTITDQSLMGKLTFDAFIQYVMSENTTSTLPDYLFTYSSNYFVAGFGVGLNF
jgi:long-chain fatty acid transport protein